MGVLNHLSTFLLLSLLPPALSHVVDKFSDVTDCNDFFMNGTTPNLPGILVDGIVQNQNRYKPICQKYNNIYRFATLYDTTNRIPVFSAYTFTGKGKSLRRAWMIEPQLENENVKLNMKCCKVVNNQAADADYYKNGMHLERGHLFPCSYTPDNDTKRSTFTLTNAVPQASSFNKGSWKTMEGRVRTALVNNCKDNNNKIKAYIEAYVVTGAVPNNNNNQLKERVNIPDLLWTAFCCYNNEKKEWMAGAHWGVNQEETNKQVLNPHTLSELYDKLKQHYPGDGDVQVFPERCSNAKIPTELENDDSSDVQGIPNKRRKVDTPRALPLKDGGDEHDYCVYDDDCVCSSVGVKGYYLPVVFVSVLVMMM
ncbi:unnamed protein product [Oncorhynchus mykiss]|uniref:DNA/RNA non-specific endonuclease domain-containing protein n=1 Tax=Oncorhynchus mykiss TaxID=8022 RepID=A0A060YX88_ONCMY|nr:unnamed protein product [Oncorhynchus mykiss]